MTSGESHNEWYTSIIAKISMSLMQVFIMRIYQGRKIKQESKTNLLNTLRQVSQQPHMPPFSATIPLQLCLTGAQNTESQ